jgi:hypothetical protein
MNMKKKPNKHSAKWKAAPKKTQPENSYGLGVQIVREAAKYKLR